MIRQLIVLFVSAIFGICALGMDVETDRMKIREGEQYPELYYDQVSDCKFEIRSWGDGWYVVARPERGGCYIAPGNIGDSVWDELFQYKRTSHDSEPGVTIFRIAFHYWFDEQSGVRRDYYGWVSLVADANEQPAVLASEVSELHALPIVGRGEPQSGYVPQGDVVCTGLMSIDYAASATVVYYKRNSDCGFIVESSGDDGWCISTACKRGTCSVVRGSVGYSVIDNLFASAGPSVGAGSDVAIFRFAFHYCWRGQDGKGFDHYGWVSLAVDADKKPFVLASEISDVPALPIIGRGEPSAPPEGPEEPTEQLTFQVIDHGDWMELAPHCIPEETKGLVEIPDFIDGKPVLAIGEAAFQDRRGITDVWIARWVGSIGYKAFSSCLGLQRITIPETITNIDERAFACSGIGEADIGGGVLVIRKETFYGCSDLSNVVIRTGVERIESGAFIQTGLKSVEVPYTTVIESNAFDSRTRIVRYGPDIACDVTLRECEKPTLMRLLGAKALCNARTVFLRPEFDKEKEIELQEPIDAARVCVQLGITPVRVEVDGKGACVDAYFRVPKIQIVKFDPVARTVKGRVIPAEGSRIAEPPQEYVFVLYYHYPDGSRSFGIKDVYCPFTEWNYALLDLSDYIKTGEFTFTYTEDLNRCDALGLFSVGISNDYYWNWENSTLVNTPK